ncbi:hypothetical protein [Nitrosophilus kaiyonis]|uniref:hypothetical protein n=1 Tax=Nitrosophilus kaiyonis TaxID=2930200 RepID=UPI0024909052|nr:hypothetical protein [Nitrosophilus kaiyonis]
MKCKKCKRGEFVYLLGFAMMVIAFNQLSVGCIEVEKSSSYMLFGAGFLIMALGAYLKSNG